MKILCKIAIILLLICLIVGAGWVTYWCFAHISEQNDPEANVVLAFVGICTPIVTLLLTFDFKTTPTEDY